jgi:hypothetical protein
MGIKSEIRNIIDARNIDLDEIVHKMFGVESQASRPLTGYGKKQSIRATVTRTDSKTEIEFFAEITFSPVPKNSDDGYTMEDAVYFQGVSVVDIDIDEDEVEYPFYRGEIISYTDFRDTYIENESSCYALDDIMETMMESIVMNEEVLERINSIWGNREPGQTELFNLRYQ